MKKLIYFILVCCAPAFGEEPIKNNLVLGFVPSRSVHEIQLSANEIARYLSAETGYDIKAVTLADYAAVAVGMKTKRVDFAFVGPLNYLVIDRKVGAVPLTAAVRNGKMGYHGLIIVNRSTDINSIADLKGHRVALGDALSASGTLYPRFAMLDAGLDPVMDIKSISLSSQSAVVMSVLEGKVEAGAIYDDARTNPEVIKYHPDILERTRVIYRTDVIPSDPQIARASMNPQQVEVLRKALIRLGSDQKSKQWLKDVYGIDGLESTSINDYKSLLAVVNKVNPSLLEERALK